MGSLRAAALALLLSLACLNLLLIGLVLPSELASTSPAAPSSTSHRHPSQDNQSASSPPRTELLDIGLPFVFPPTPMDPCLFSRVGENLGLENGPLINVIHVPKSAGSTARYIFRDIAKRSRGRVRFTDSNAQERCENGSTVPNSGIFVGHTGWGLSDHAPANLFNIILVRDPVSRFISFVNYMKQERRAPPEWHNVSFSKLLLDYKIARATKPALLMNASSSMSNRLIHHALIDQLSMLASYKCVSPTPDYNPMNCSRPSYGFDSMLGTSSTTELCSMSNMKRLAFENIKKADLIIAKDDFNKRILLLGKFHFDFMPWYLIPRTVNRTMRKYASLDISKEAIKWLEEWLADEIQVYRAAVRVSDDTYNRIKTCSNRYWFSQSQSRPQGTGRNGR